MGSVKRLILQELSSPGIAILEFSDNYSVFDWGKMPDKIPDKGRSLCTIGAYFYELLEQEGIKTHYRGLISGSATVKLADMKEAVSAMEIELFDRIYPEEKKGRYDYSEFRKRRNNYRIPIEVIYRNILPPGSSVFSRLSENELSLRDLGLDSYPEAYYRFSRPFIEASTKCEKYDRYIDWKEVSKMLGLSEDVISEIKDLAVEINRIISGVFSARSLNNEDGKLEFALNPSGDLLLSDTVGTPDESRISYKGYPVSKELIRQYYRNTSWFEQILEARHKVPHENPVSSPPPLPPAYINIMSKLYRSLCNHITGKRWFVEESLDSVVKQLKKI